MAERLIESATLTLVGMVVVFITLVVLMFAIILLTKTTPTREEHKEEIRETAPEVLPSQVEPGVSDKEAVAAMAVALAQMMEESETVSAGQ
ncbi:MAG: OadG family protein [Chloroflexota bacterium]